VLELGKVTADHSDVETPQDRFLGFAIEEELEGRLDATLRRVRVHRQSFARVSSHCDVMASFALANTDDDLEFEWITFAGSLDLDHRPHRNPSISAVMVGFSRHQLKIRLECDQEASSFASGK
jgi:hypothetical protein